MKISFKTSQQESTDASGAFDAGADHVVFYLPPPPSPATIEQLATAAADLLG